MAVTDTTTLTKPIQDLYNKSTSLGFTENGQFWKSATVKKVDATGGKSAVFDVLTVGAISTAALAETGAGTPVTLAMTQKTVTLVEYGDNSQVTKKVNLTSYSNNLAHAAWKMGHMASDTLDKLARGALDAETGATWNSFAGSATSVVTTTITDELTGDNVREAFALLRARKATTLPGGYFLCYIHPHVLKDIKDETTNSSFTVKELYNGTERIQPIRDEVGQFEGFRFVMTSMGNLQSKAGDGTTTSAASADVYTTYFVGDEALGQASAGPVPQFDVHDSPGGPADPYKRMQITSWYALTGFGALQTDSLQKFFSSSSVALNGA